MRLILSSKPALTLQLQLQAAISELLYESRKIVEFNKNHKKVKIIF